MKKKLVVVAMFLCMTLVSTPGFSIPWWCYSQRLNDHSFDSPNTWDYANGAYWNYTLDRCSSIFSPYYGGEADITAAGATVSQMFTVGAAPAGTMLELTLKTGSGQASWWDQVRIYLDKDTVNGVVTETVATVLLSEVGSCRSYTFTPSGTYANSTVTIRIVRSNFSNIETVVDEVRFWEHTCS